jgi:mannose/cellobiose epimerase-like protein (N-acyl-D-glucosamine 2-epimerase family)
MYAKYFNDPEYKKRVEHGVNYLRSRHLNSTTGGYVWQLKNDVILDDTNHCYGLAFVLLGYSSAVKAGMVDAKNYIYETFDLMEKRFWLEDHGLYGDEFSADWTTQSPYRGQNANMHSCEAMIAAYEATNDDIFLKRARLIAHNICVRQAGLCGGLIWEHYNKNWQVDWHYNKTDPKNLFRPWGFQPGHLTEWAKLLLMLNRYFKEEWMVKRATDLFDAAMKTAWDEENGGINYGFAPDGKICDGDKYFWVQAETIAAAAHLAVETGNNKYWDWYQKIWQYSWDHMIDHKYGAWYCILNNKNTKYNDLKSPTGKTDYHTMGACYEVLSII